MKKQPLLQKLWSVLAMMVVVAVVATTNATAIPVPHGIMGTIHDLDGVTEVPAGVDFSINNTANGFYLEGKTGRGSSGRYAASVAGNNGDSIVIKARNIEHESTRTVTLDGVMRNVNILLNMTLKPYPPNITSTPTATATEDALYSYDVEAVDYNYDTLTYELSVAPEGMVISSGSGLIEWTPSDEHVGSNGVVVSVSDGNLTTNQSFLVMVENVNDAPDILSTPPANAIVNKEYSYHVNATDPDNETLLYSLAAAPDKMGISNDGMVTWTPRKPNVGNHTVIVEVSDGIAVSSQLFTITVADFNPPGKQQQGTGGSSRSSTGSSGSGGTSFAPAARTESQEKKLVVAGRSGRVPVKEVVIRFKSPVADASVEVTELKESPKEAKPLQKRVYTYLEIRKNFASEQLEEAIIEFSVEKEWLDSNAIYKENVALNHYRGTEWKELPTSVIEENDEEVSYEATTDSFSVFAISVKSEVSVAEANRQLRIETAAGKLQEAYSISGFILKSNGKLQVEEGTPFTITNLRTNATVNGKTGVGHATGAFFAIITGRIGDEMSMREGNIRKHEGTFILEGDMEGITAVERGIGLVFLQTNFENTLDSSITGYVTAVQEVPKSIAAAVLFLIFVAIIVFYRPQLQRLLEKTATTNKTKRRSEKKNGVMKKTAAGRGKTVKPAKNKQAYIKRAKNAAVKRKKAAKKKAKKKRSVKKRKNARK